jgi:hypothetical protein
MSAAESARARAHAERVSVGGNLRVLGFLTYVCECGGVQDLEGFVEKFGVTALDLKTNFGSPAEASPFVCACGRGNLDNVRWLVNKFGLTAADLGANAAMAVRWARDGGHVETVQFLMTVAGVAASMGGGDAGAWVKSAEAARAAISRVPDVQLIRGPPIRAPDTRPPLCTQTARPPVCAPTAQAGVQRIRGPPVRSQAAQPSASPDESAHGDPPPPYTP